MKKIPYKQKKSELIRLVPKTDPKTGLFIAEPREDPLSPIQLTEVQLENLKQAAKNCKVTFRFQRPLVVNAPPMTIEGFKVLREWTEEDGSTVTEYELPEEIDLRDLLPKFRLIDPEFNFLKDDDQEYTSEP